MSGIFDLFLSGGKDEVRDPDVGPGQRGYRLFASVYGLVFGLSLRQGRRLAIEALETAQESPGIGEVGVTGRGARWRN